MGVSLSKSPTQASKTMKVNFSQVIEVSAKDKMRGLGHLSGMDAIEVCDGCVRRWGTRQI